MQKIVLISCVSKKLNKPAKAKDLYISPLFKKSLKYAFSFNPDKIFILSAKHHLLNLENQIEPYNLTLNDFSTQEIRKWSNKVLNELNKVTDFKKDKFIFLAGSKYRKYLLPKIKNYVVPMQGLRFGEQLKFLNGKIYK